MAKSIRVKILRQAGKDAPKQWETYEVPYRENLNVISVLLEIQKNPTTVEGKSVQPPVWEAGCLEEVCGACTMVINGGVRQACTALIDDVANLVGDKFELSLEPMTKFPVVRDLMVDRSKMFENLKKVKAWVPVDGSFDRGMAPPQDDDVRVIRYALSRCMTCGCCQEVCPQVNAKSPFVGPAAIAQALLFNMHPIGKSISKDRLDYLTSEEGVSGCGNAQNCVKACPKSVPLTKAIALINREATAHKLKRWMGMLEV